MNPQTQSLEGKAPMWSPQKVSKAIEVRWPESPCFKDTSGPTPSLTRSVKMLSKLFQVLTFIYLFF